MLVESIYYPVIRK